jgi:hypothetical protein
MRTLLARHGFDVRWDKSVGELGAELGMTLRRAVEHLRFAEATRRQA